MKKKKGVIFNNSLKVVLIPCRGEYKGAGLIEMLWWSSSEFKEFQQTSNSEILLMAKSENLDVRSARRHLYQPSLCSDSQFELIQNACSPRSNDEDNDDYDYFDDVDVNAEENPDQADDTLVYSVRSPSKLLKSKEKFSEQDNDNEALSALSVCRPVSSLENLSKALGRETEDTSLSDDMNMFFGNFADDDLNLVVPVKEPKPVTFEKRKSIKSKAAHAQPSSPSTVSTAIAISSAVLLAVVVLCSGGF